MPCGIVTRAASLPCFCLYTLQSAPYLLSVVAHTMFYIRRVHLLPEMRGCSAILHALSIVLSERAISYLCSKLGLNSLSGTLPPQLGNLTGLKTL